MTQWYFVENRKPIGPFSIEEMKGQISAGRIGEKTFVIKQGESEWVKAEDHRELKELFAKSSHPSSEGPPLVPSEVAAAHWVVLVAQKSPEGRSSLLQQGPYSVETLRGMIQKGEVSYSDYGWTKGMERWVRLGSRAEFSQPQLDSAELESPVADFAHSLDTGSKFSDLERESEEFIQHIVQQQRMSTEQLLSEALGVHEVPPSEACGDDLLVGGPTLHLVAEKTEILAEQSPPVSGPELRVVANEPAAPRASVGDSKVALPPEDKVRSVPHPESAAKVESEFNLSQRPLWKIAIPVIVSVAVALIVGSVMLTMDLKKARQGGQFSELLKLMKEKTTLPVEPQGDLLENKPAVNTPEQALPPAAAEPKSENNSPGQRLESEKKTATPQAPKVFKPATFLNLDSYVWKKGRGYLPLRTDASAGQKVRLVLEATTGQVLNYLSYYRVLEVVTSGEVQTPIDLTKAGVPPGHFTIEATLSGFRDRVSTVVHQSEITDFERSLAAHRKRISLRQQTEKGDLVNLIKNSEEIVADFSRNLSLRESNPSQWKTFVQSWRRRLVSTDHPNLNGRVLQQQRNFAFPKTWLAFQELRLEILEVASLGRSDQKTPDLVKRIQNRIRGLKDEIVNLSGWR